MAAAALLVGMPGCGQQRAWRPLAPGLFGMRRVSARLWVEPGMPDTALANLRLAVERARRRMETFYGPLRSTPVVVACITTRRAREMGLGWGHAHTLLDRAILLGPAGRTERTIAHEWSHAELYQRLAALGPAGPRRVPRWFDEGLASAITEDTASAEPHWRRIEALGIPTPSLNELITLRQFARARATYDGVRVDTLPHVSVVYATSAHEVLGWLGRAGAHAPARLVEAMAAGESFGRAYLRLGGGEPRR